MTLDGSDDIVIAGRMFVTGRDDELVTIKFANADGAPLWEAKEGGAARMDDRALGVAVGNDDCPVVSGLVQNADNSATLMIVKYDGANGGALWARNESGLVNDQSGDGWVCVDEAGDVIAAWKEWGGATSYDIAVAKYDGSDGTPVWSVSYNHLGASADDPSEMILDDAGNPILVGSTAGDYLIVKLDGSNGATVWSQSYAGPQGWYDVANAVTFAPNGDIVVTGFSDGTGTSWDVATLGLEPTIGKIRWVERWDGVDHITDEGLALTIDPLGRLYVSGYSYTEAQGMDQLVLAYQLTVGTGVGQLPPAVVVLEGYPNPFNPRITLSYALEVEGPALLELLDIKGRRVVKLIDGFLPAGRGSIVWQGLDVGGHIVPSGTYLARMRSGSSTTTTKITLSR